MKKIVRIMMVVVGIYLFFNLTAQAQFYFMENKEIGMQAPDFTLKTLAGTNVNFTELRRGKGVIMFFWTTWCSHCRKAIKELGQKEREISEKGIRLVFIDTGEKRQVVEKYLEAHKIKVDVLLDEKSSVAVSYGIVGLPTFVFVDETGIIKAIQHRLPDNYETILSKVRTE